MQTPVGFFIDRTDARMNLIAGLLLPTEGALICDGREIAAEVSTGSARRRLFDLSPLPAAPAFKPIEDGR